MPAAVAMRTRGGNLGRLSAPALISSKRCWLLSRGFRPRRARPVHKTSFLPTHLIRHAAHSHLCAACAAARAGGSIGSTNIGGCDLPASPHAQITLNRAAQCSQRSSPAEMATLKGSKHGEPFQREPFFTVHYTGHVPDQKVPQLAFALK